MATGRVLRCVKLLGLLLKFVVVSLSVRVGSLRGRYTFLVVLVDWVYRDRMSRNESRNGCTVIFWTERWSSSGSVVGFVTAVDVAVTLM